jgi:hypothetical protein
MTLSTDIAADFGLVTDFLAPVTVDGASVNNALRRAVTTSEAARSGGKYLSSDTVFHLDIAELPSRPAIGGQIVDQDGDTYTILEVAKQTLANRWRCIARSLYLDPAQTVTIQQATFSKSTTGAQEPTWTDVATNVPAKVVIESETVDDTHDGRSLKQTATVYFATPQTLTPQYRIVSGSTILKVIEWQGFDDLKALFRCKCEVSPWPES